VREVKEDRERNEKQRDRERDPCL